MFSSSLPRDEGLRSNTMIMPKRIYDRDPRYEINTTRPIIILGKPNTLDTRIVNPSRSQDGFNIASFSMKKIIAKRIDPRDAIKNIERKNTLPKPDTRKVNFLKMKKGVDSNVSMSSDVKQKPTFQVYSKIIRQIYTVIMPDMIQVDKTLLNDAYESLQREYVKNKSKLNDNILDNIVRNYLSKVKDVFERWYNESDKSFNPILAIETGVPIDDLLQTNNEELYDLLKSKKDEEYEEIQKREQKEYEDETEKDVLQQRLRYQTEKELLLDQKRREQKEYENKFNVEEEELIKLSIAEKQQEADLETELKRLSIEATRLLKDQEEKEKEAEAENALEEVEKKRQEDEEERLRIIREKMLIRHKELENEIDNLTTNINLAKTNGTDYKDDDQKHTELSDQLNELDKLIQADKEARLLDIEHKLADIGTQIDQADLYNTLTKQEYNMLVDEHTDLETERKTLHSEINEDNRVKRETVAKRKADIYKKTREAKENKQRIKEKEEDAKQQIDMYKKEVKTRAQTKRQDIADAKAKLIEDALKLEQEQKQRDVELEEANEAKLIDLVNEREAYIRNEGLTIAKVSKDTFSDDELREMIGKISEQYLFPDNEDLKSQYSSALKSVYKTKNRKTLSHIAKHIFSINWARFNEMVKEHLFLRIYNAITQKLSETEFSNKYKEFTGSVPGVNLITRYIEFATQQKQGKKPTREAKKQGKKRGKNQGKKQNIAINVPEDYDDNASIAGDDDISAFNNNSIVNSPRTALTSQNTTTFTTPRHGNGRKKQLSKSLKSILKKYNL